MENKEIKTGSLGWLLGLTKQLLFVATELFFYSFFYLERGDCDEGFSSQLQS